MIYNLPNEFLKNKNSTKTNNEIFEKNGYLICRNFIDLQNIKYPFLHKIKEFVGKNKTLSYQTFDDLNIDSKIYNEYNFIHHQFSKKIENILNISVLPTFYCGKSYFPNESEDISVYDEKCEIVICANIGFSTKEKLVYHLIDNDNNIIDFRLNLGDILIFKPREIPFWSEKVKGDELNSLRRLFNLETKYYHHMMFFYILENSENCHLANEFY